MDHALNLALGTTLSLRPLRGSIQQRITGELFGKFKKQSLLIAWDKKPKNDFKIGDAFVVSFQEQNIHYAFQAVVQAIAMQPFPHIYLSYPDSSKGVMLRRSPRHPLDLPNIPLALSVQQHGRQVMITMDDISHSGAKLSADLRLGNVNEDFTIELHAPQSGEHISLTCVIRYVRNRKQASEVLRQQSCFSHGVEFKDLGDSEQQFIDRLILANRPLHNQQKL
ncbi:MAG: flagellar brake protein [Gammaproteobacteria bacterium]|nr:flagellar brake protein [Gammaproteobacteria bacterium]MDH5729677.1 flagellar brake protein [Gammaproteobacteria bacterium]